ncbi:hypothetical protein [Candidatus Albibeggiatoa sp. nov. NOAA]|uniref:hypothetical protein n=1 Tax=Candidatus Albibeggiatoa sp. nov. NOAA TaxID=3162724 RepID=UPI00330022A3|nr:hypothetical protein [Thiotrichaceae bacterium]
MLLKQNLIKQIEQLSPTELILLDSFVQTLTQSTKQQQNQSDLKQTLQKARLALSNCQGSLSEDIIQAREERI